MACLGRLVVLLLGVLVLFGEAVVELLVVVAVLGIPGLFDVLVLLRRCLRLGRGVHRKRRLDRRRRLLVLRRGDGRGHGGRARWRADRGLLRRHLLLGRRPLRRRALRRRPGRALLRRLVAPGQVRGGGLQCRLVDRRQLEADRADVLDQVRLRRDAVLVQVEVDGGGPDPLAVAVEGDRDGGLRRRGQPVDVVPALGHDQRRLPQVLQEPVLLVDLEVGAVDHRAARRADGVEDPGDPEVRPRLLRAEPGHPPDQPFGDVLLGAREHPQLVGVGLRRRREVPHGFVAVVLEVVAGRVVELVARVEPGAPAVAVHAPAQPAEQRGDVVRGQPFVHRAVLGDDLAGQLVVPPDGSVLRGDLAPVARGGTEQGKSDLLDQGVLLGRVQLRRRLCHGDILTVRARECTPHVGFAARPPGGTRSDLV